MNWSDFQRFATFPVAFIGEAVIYVGKEHGTGKELCTLSTADRAGLERSQCIEGNVAWLLKSDLKKVPSQREKS